jgi:transposase/predicted nucleic acid-binding Zn finger protein
MVIAATQKLTQKGKVWIVPSSTGRGKYTVHPDDETPFCSCPDFEETGCRCKHLFAVEFTMKRDMAKDGTVVETRSVTFTQKKTYKQEWGVYNLAQTEEKRRFLVLLHDLCRGLPNPPQAGPGRKRSDMSDMVFTAVYKVYEAVSGRRFGTDLEEAFASGYLTRKLNGMMVWQFLESPLLTPVLHQLVTISALPLRAVETTFGPDSTGFSTSRFVRWFDEKYGATRSGRDWVKAHCMAGVRTHVITAVEILDRNAADCPQFKPLLDRTAAHFDVKEVPADKAYLSYENLELVHNLGATAFIPFKINSVQGEAGTIWEKMFHFYSMHREEFDQHYHQRSNVETAFSMVKAKFRDHVRSKSPIAMTNEVLCKVLAHNICCLIMSQCELGIDVQFWGEPKTTVAETVESVAVTTEEPAEAGPAVATDAEPQQASVRPACGCVGA